jgi:hypothetical protein
MPIPLRTTLRLINDCLGQVSLSAAFWIVIASYLMLAPYAPPIQALEFTISCFYPVFILSLLGLLPIVGQIIYLIIAQPVTVFLSGGADNPLLAASWRMPSGAERLLGPFSGILPAEGTVLSFILGAGIWLSIALSVQITVQAVSRWLFRVWPPAPKPNPPVPAAASGSGFFSRCQSANDKVLFPLMGLAILGSVVFAVSYRPAWVGVVICAAAVLAALAGNLLFSLIRIPPGSGFAIYALAMPEAIRIILSGAEDFSPPTLTLPWTGPAGSLATSLPLVEYAVAAGWLWMIYLLLHRASGFLDRLFPRVWGKPLPATKAVVQGRFAAWKSRLATWIVVLLSLGGIAAIIWSTIIGEDYRHPVVHSFRSIAGTSVCIEKCDAYGGAWAILPENIPPGVPRTMDVWLDATPGPLFLRIEPRRQAGLAFIDLSIGLQWIDPNGKVVAQIDPQDRFPGSAQSQYWNYRKDIPLPALLSGKYTLVVTPYDGGIAWITVTIRKNP